MIDKAKNKAMESEPSQTEAARTQPFFFSGEGRWKPVTIHAESIAQATEEWERVKEPNS